MKLTWMVRAGRKGRYLEDFRDKSMVAVRWVGLSSLKPFDSKEK